MLGVDKRNIKSMEKGRIVLDKKKDALWLNYKRQKIFDCLPENLNKVIL